MRQHPTLRRVAAGGRILRPITILTGFVLAVGAAVAARRITAYEIAENSMSPALNPGDWVAAWRRPGTVRPGDVVIFERPARPGFDPVKRVTGISGDRPCGWDRPLEQGEVWVAGDNPDAGSVDSRSFGPIRTGEIAARVVVRYAPLPPALIARR